MQHTANATRAEREAPAISLEGTLRPALAALSTAILKHAAAVASAGPPLHALDPARLADRLDTFVTPTAERRAIADAIVGLRTGK